MKAYGGNILQLELNKMVEALKKKLIFFTGVIDHATRIILWAFTGAGVIVPVYWQALKRCFTWQCQLCPGKLVFFLLYLLPFIL
jgi:uncharacterized membrane protein